jgi:hypothetical protein
MKRLALKIFIYTALTVLGFGVATFVFWNLQPKDVLTIRGPVKVKPVVAKGEGAVTLHFDYCKNLDVEGTIQQSFVSNKTELLSPEVQDTQHKICTKDQAVTILIPPQTAPDRYRIKYVATYKINPITTVVETFQSEQFDVVSNDTVLPNPLPSTLPNDPNFYNQQSPILTPSTNGLSQTNNSSQSAAAAPNSIQGQAQASGSVASPSPAPVQDTKRPSLVQQFLNLIGL